MRVGVRIALVTAWAMAPALAFADSPDAHECRYRASFNCALADDAASRAICSDPALMAADCALGYAYRDARSLPGANKHESLRKDQRHWAAVRDTACAKRTGATLTACLTAETEKRLRWFIDHYKLAVAGKIYEPFAKPRAAGRQ